MKKFLTNSDGLNESTFSRESLLIGTSYNDDFQIL
jgi:hypothetical protein